jgi:Family of unknown function (DUF5681)
MAENSKQNSERGQHLAQHRFKVGQSGNPGGRPKKKPITEIYERLLADPNNLALIERAIVKVLCSGSMAMVMQLREMTDRLEGKVTLPVAADITVGLADALAKARQRMAMNEGPRLEGKSDTLTLNGSSTVTENSGVSTQ